jgi:hypothetical protein
MTLLWFPPVDLNYYSNPLEQLRLQFVLTTWILTSRTILRIIHVANNVTPHTCPYHYLVRTKLMITFLMLIILDLGVNLTLSLVGFTCWVTHIILELVSEWIQIPLTTRLVLEQICLELLTFAFSHTIFYLIIPLLAHWFLF